MPKGWIRSYTEEQKKFESTDYTHATRKKRAKFRANFTTTLYSKNNPASQALSQLPWGAVVSLPKGLSDTQFTEAVFDNNKGFVRTDHVVELSYVKRNKALKVKLRLPNSKKKVELLWGDCVQIIKRGKSKSEVRARGYYGKMRNVDLTSEALLEVYFIDVGQGDSVLVRTPDARHLLVDGGLERKRQLTGKNAADFVDWKFFFDYGDFRIRLDSMTASHPDNDHYGGLHDLVRTSPFARQELDCLGTNIVVLHHPGLSPWKKQKDANGTQADGLGPTQKKHFTRLLRDRKDAENQLSRAQPTNCQDHGNHFFAIFSRMTKTPKSNASACRGSRFKKIKNRYRSSGPPWTTAQSESLDP